MKTIGGAAMDGRVAARLSALDEAFARFRACAAALPSGRFLERMNGWSPRDVTAHFIGWNRYTIEGSREILRGVCPFYLADEPNDFSTVNRESVERYASSDRDELLAELDASFGDLKTFLLTLPAPQWDKDFGVRFKGHVITVEDNVEGLRMDYDRHREAIEAWEEKAGR
jgi:hypothetical protein